MLECRCGLSVQFIRAQHGRQPRNWWEPSQGLVGTHSFLDPAGSAAQCSLHKQTTAPTQELELGAHSALCNLQVKLGLVGPLVPSTAFETLSNGSQELMSTTPRLPGTNPRTGGHSFFFNLERLDKFHRCDLLGKWRRDTSTGQQHLCRECALKQWCALFFMGSVGADPRTELALRGAPTRETSSPTRATRAPTQELARLWAFGVTMALGCLYS